MKRSRITKSENQKTVFLLKPDTKSDLIDMSFSEMIAAISSGISFSNIAQLSAIRNEL
jgi:hypothetical protein